MERQKILKTGKIDNLSKQLSYQLRSYLETTKVKMKMESVCTQVTLNFLTQTLSKN